MKEGEEPEERRGAPLAASSKVAEARAAVVTEEAAAGETTATRPLAAEIADPAGEEEAVRLVQTRAPVAASMAATVPSPEASRATRL